MKKHLTRLTTVLAIFRLKHNKGSHTTHMPHTGGSPKTPNDIIEETKNKEDIMASIRPPPQMQIPLLLAQQEYHDQNIVGAQVEYITAIRNWKQYFTLERRGNLR